MKPANTSRHDGKHASILRKEGHPGRKGPLPGILLKNVAARLEIRPSYLSQIVQGNRTPSMELARRMADLLGWSMDDVWGLREGKIPAVF